MHTFTVVLLILLATAYQQNVVQAQSHDDPYYTVYYWFSPGRIAGIAVGVAVLLILILSFLIAVCRRRRKQARAASNITLPAYSAEDAQPRPYPSWQQPQIPLHGPYADPRGYYSTPGTRAAPAHFGRAKPAMPPRDARGTPSAARTPSSSDGERFILSSPVRKPVATIQAQRPAPPGQVQRPASASQMQSTMPPGQVQSVAPSEGVSSALSSRQVEEQIPPPRPAYTAAVQSVSGMNGREPSPPPYSPLARSSEPSAAYAAR